MRKPLKSRLPLIFGFFLVTQSVAVELLSDRLYSDDFWTKIRAINEVGDGPEEIKRKHFSDLLIFLRDDDQSIRTSAAISIAKIAINPEKAIPALLENYKYPHGEEGLIYVDAVVVYGEDAIPYLNKILESSGWLIRTRACDTLKEIGQTINRTFDCKD